GSLRRRVVDEGPLVVRVAAVVETERRVRAGADDAGDAALELAGLTHAALHPATLDAATLPAAHLPATLSRARAGRRRSCSAAEPAGHARRDAAEPRRACCALKRADTPAALLLAVASSGGRAAHARALRFRHAERPEILPGD